MKILAIGRLHRRLPNWRAYLNGEAQMLWEWHAAGLLWQSHYCRDWHCAVLMLECRDLHEAEQYLHLLPSVKTGVLEFELTALEPFDALARIFCEHQQPLPWWWAESESIEK